MDAKSNDQGGRPDELASSLPDAADPRAPQPRPLDPRRAERLANPEAAEDEAHELLATSLPGSTRDREAVEANPDTAADEAERVYEVTTETPDDERPAEDVREKG